MSRLMRVHTDIGVICADEGNPVEAMIGMAGEPEDLSRQFELAIHPNDELEDGAEFTFELAMLDSAGNPVTVSFTVPFDAS